ncbi:MAG: HIT family protein [Pseudomonadota bacterium]|nr:HIT family protein [Pseudomonadota bacterium]
MYYLHERLAADTHPLGTTRLCEVRLMNDKTWPWVILVPMVAGVREIYQLDSGQQARLIQESSALGQGMMELFGGDKLNVAALGNMVPQLHLHHIVRFEGDPAWPSPVWGKQAPEAYLPGGLNDIRDQLKPIIASLA